MEQSSVQAGRRGEGKSDQKFGSAIWSALIYFLADKSSLTASVATAGKLNKHRHSCFAVQIYGSEGLGAARWPRCDSAAAGQSCTADSEEQPSDGLRHYPFLPA